MSAVLFVSHTAEKGGAELFLIDLLRGGPEGWRAGFLSDGPAARDLAAEGRLAAVVQADAGLLAVKRGGGGLSLAPVLGLLRAGRALARTARSFDVIVANSQKALFVCAVASFISRRPMIWMLHDIITDPAFSRANRTAAVAVARLFARRVVANSQVTAQGYIDAGGDPGRVRLVYNGFDPASWPAGGAAEGQALRQAFGLDHRPVAGMFGRLAAWKGQHILLQALAKTPGVQAVIVGGPLFGEEAQEAELKRLAAELGLEDRVHFTGFRSDIRALMAGVDIVIHASTHPEPFGRVVVEGQLSGKPVIAADAGGVGEIVRHEETGILVPPGDVEALAAALARLVADAPLRRRLADAGRTAAAARFSLDRSRADMAEVVEAFIFP